MKFLAIMNSDLKQTLYLVVLLDGGIFMISFRGCVKQMEFLWLDHEIVRTRAYLMWL